MIFLDILLETCVVNRKKSLSKHACVSWHHNRHYLNLHPALISRLMKQPAGSVFRHTLFSRFIHFILIHISAHSGMNSFIKFSFTTPILYLISQRSSLAINCLSTASQWPPSICSADDRKNLSQTGKNTDVQKS